MSTPPEYRLQYLPLFWDDLNRAATYIAVSLQNPAAAERLVDRVEEAILKMRSTPTAAPLHRSTRTHPVPYRWLAVGNYRVFYVIEGDVIEVRRLLYGGRDLEGLLP